MGNDSIFDIAVDLLKQRHQSARLEMHRRFKGKKPYRMEKLSDTELIRQYLEFTPEKEQFDRENFGDEAVDSYHQNMRNVIRRKYNA